MRLFKCKAMPSTVTEVQTTNAHIEAPDLGRQTAASSIAAALGCADPNRLVEIRPGDTVLDIGAGSCGDINVLVSEAGRVGADGVVYGLSAGNGAERARIEAEAPNVRFVDGHVDSVPLADGSVDVVVSNCLVCLSANHASVVREAARLLGPNGRLGLADVVTLGEIPESVRAAARVIGTALDAEDYKMRLHMAGFNDPEIDIVHPFTREDLGMVGPMLGDGIAQCSEDDIRAAEGKIAGAFVRARRSEAPCDCC